jgi:hypothetical protein
MVWGKGKQVFRVRVGGSDGCEDFRPHTARPIPPPHVAPIDLFLPSPFLLYTYVFFTAFNSATPPTPFCATVQTILHRIARAPSPSHVRSFVAVESM